MFKKERRVEVQVRGAIREEEQCERGEENTKMKEERMTPRERKVKDKERVRGRGTSRRKCVECKKTRSVCLLAKS